MNTIHVIPPPAGEIATAQGTFERLIEAHTVQSETIVVDSVHNKGQEEFDAAKKFLVSVGALPSSTPVEPFTGRRSSVTPFKTFFGMMTALEFAIYKASLTPSPAKRGYQALSCGHKFAAYRIPSGGCKTCWNAYYATNPAELVGIKNLLDQSREKALIHQFGIERVKQAKRVLANGITEDELGKVAA